uniref:coiled-coil domain-containing protein 87 n=1 Tax=Pristiophorus japonicus TaxID=55135 RepID=UPI00398EB376
MMTKGLDAIVVENKSSKPSNRNGLHSMVRSTAKELHQQYKDILGPLSLFISNTTKDIKLPVLQLERPVTPIDQNVKLAPASLAELCELIQRRIAAKSEVPSVSRATQQALGGMIIADVKLLWKEFEHNSEDITLTNMENKELSRRMTTHIITVCEQLFLHYLHMVDVVRQRSVFTDEANLSRLKAQLALDCSRFLNIQAIKRCISKEIKSLRKSADYVDEAPDMENLDKYKYKIKKSMSPEAPFTLKHLFNLSRPKKVPKPKPRIIEKDLQEINENMLQMDLEQIYKVLPHKVESAGDHRQMQIVAVRTPNLPKQQNEEQILTKRLQPEHNLDLMSWQSNPNLRAGKPFSKEPSSFHYTAASQDKFLHSRSKMTKAERKEKEHLSIADDLKKLLQMSTVNQGDDTDPETTLPPLLQALTYDRTSEMKKRNREKMLMELEEEEEREKLKRKIQLKVLEHAQPATVNIRVHKKMIAQTADVRVSDRKYIDSVNLQIYQAVYNHIVGEIDPEMVKTLDKNLTSGEELQEIYKELLNIIPDDYLFFDKDPMIIPPAVNVDLSGCFVSSTLSKRKREHIINPELVLSEPEDRTKRYLLMKQEVKESEFVSVTQDVNVDDYLKYIYAQDSDYLAVIFHFYNSDAEEEEAKKALIFQELKLKREEEIEDAEIHLIKEKFIPGAWNINSVMLGGLGKQPLPEVAKVRLPTADEKTRAEVQKLLGKIPEFEDLDDVQKRLQRIWTILHFPDWERLDMAIKYSSHKHRAHISKCHLITPKYRFVLME